MICSVEAGYPLQGHPDARSLPATHLSFKATQFPLLALTPILLLTTGSDAMNARLALEG